MTAVVLAPGEHDADGAVPLTLRSEDRLRDLAAPIRRLSAAMIAILIGSAAIHGALVVTALVMDRAEAPAPVKEIAVEIVQDIPKAQPPKAQPLKAQPPKTASQKTEPPKPTQPKQMPPGAAPPPPKPPPVEAKAPPTPPMPQVKAQAPQTDFQNQAAAERDALEKQLAELRAQQAQLKTDTLVRQPPPAPRGGPLDASRQALALPSVGADGEAVSYPSLVFSQLAKAKEVGEYHGDAGTTGVHFEIDADGRLLNEAIAVSSGKANLDAEALDIVRRAAPFPPPPKDAERTFDANVNFISSPPDAPGR